ncbi:MAG: hypothetical protein WBM32_11920 [Crocosphaera sp.]
MSRQNIQSPLDLGKSQITYPQIFYPPLLQSFLKQQQLTYPRYPKPQYPRSIWDIPVSSNLIYPVGGVGLFVLGFVAVIKGLSLSAISFGLFSWVGVIWGLQQFIRWWGRRRKQYHQEYQPQYDAQLKQWQRANKVRDRYLKNAHKHQEKQLESRRQKLRHLLKGKVEQATAESDAQKGVSETKFLEVLQSILPTVKFGGEFPIPNFSHPYSQDMVFIDQDTGLSINIEIDEPYEGKKKQPHHCLDDDKDRKRNQFFTERNWVVVRFAEEQVVKNPQGCCRYLVEVIVNLNQDISLFKKVQEFPSLEPIKAWTSSEARQLAVWRYRETYLHEAGVYRQSNRESKKKIN